MVTLALAGCQKLSLRSQNPDDDEIKPPETQFVKDQVTVSGLNPITIESVGLVTNLDSTGGDPPPSMYRTMLINDMKKRGVSNPNAILQDPHKALVLIRAAVPPVIEVGDHFDVEVVLPENTEASSLKGGWLMEAHLSEQAMVPNGRPHAGHVLARVQGPILLSMGEGESMSRGSSLKRGKILGGGKYTGGLLKKERMLGLYVRSDIRSVRTTKKIADQIGKRFHYHEHGIKKPLAEAKTDQHVELKVHPRYKENFIHYVQVVRNIALDETAIERKERMERLRKSLLNPDSAMKSATELEAIGDDGILILKEGLKSPDPEVRFFSAHALAYLGQTAGTTELALAARNEPAFRVFALAALTTLATPEAREELKKMMIEPSIEIETESGAEQEVSSAETRYGAFRALWTIDKKDEFIGGEMLNDEFNLHVINSQGDSMVHLTRFKVPQVVVFGADQMLRTPISLSAGRHIMIRAQSGSDVVTVSRFEAHSEDQEIKTTRNVVDIIRAVGKLKAAYPDVAQMLVQADRQSNLPGRLAIDAMPQGGRIYHRVARADGSSAQKKDVRVGDPASVPNMFPTPEPRSARELADPELTATEPKSPPSGQAGETGTASLADVSEGESSKSSSQSSGSRGGLQGLFRRNNNNNNNNNSNNDDAAQD
jgi:flagellar basal body P-ring protein FlgI